MKIYFNGKSSSAAGFTLVELLVAMTLFIVVIGISAGSFIQILRSQRMIVSLISANNNAVLTLEEMTREVRTGRDFREEGGDFSFVNSRSENVIYHRNPADSSLEKSVNAGDFKKLTAVDVRVTRFSFSIFQGDSGSPFPPRITMLVAVGAAGLPFETPVINLQMSVSARNFE